MAAFMHPELPLEDRSIPETGPTPKGRSTGKASRRKKKRAQPQPVLDDDTPASEHAGEEEPVQPAIDPAAASWNHRGGLAEGLLGDVDLDRIRGAKAGLRAAVRAFARHEGSIGRSQESLRKALARSYGWGLQMRDQPDVINALLAEKRIRNTKPVRDNLFLAAVKLASPGETADAQTRWAGALAFAAVHQRKSDDVAEFLRTTGIREAADGWTEIRRAGKPKKAPSGAKPDPLDVLRSTLRPISLPDNCPSPGSDVGPFLLIAERAEDGRLIGYAALRDERLTTAAAKLVLRFARAESDGSAAS